jgi:CHAT domain-containing protein
MPYQLYRCTVFPISICLGLLLRSIAPLPAQNAPLPAQNAPLQPQAEVQALLDRGVQAYRTQDMQEALRLYGEALEKARALKDSAGEVSALRGSAVACYSLGQLPKALDLFEQALNAAKRIGDARNEAGVLNGMGLTYTALGNPQKALECYDSSVKQNRQVGNKAGESSALTNMGILCFETGQLNRALECYNQALALAREMKNQAGEGSLLTNIAIVYTNKGDLQKALEYCQQALPLHRAVGNLEYEANTLQEMGLIYSQLGRTEEAMKLFREVLPIYKKTGNKRYEAGLLMNMGIICSDSGQSQEALEYLHQALPLFQEAGDQKNEASVNNSLGNLYDRIHQPENALKFYARALELYQTAGDRGGEADAYVSLGNCYSELKENAKALELFQKALPMQKAAGKKLLVAAILVDQGIVYQSMGRPARALELYRQALPELQKMGNRHDAAATMTNMGTAYEALGQPDRAMEIYRKALPLHKAAGDLQYTSNTLNNMALIAEQKGQTREAEQYFQECLKIKEGIRTGLARRSEAKSSYLESQIATYQEYIHFLLKLHSLPSAFVWTQKVKARSLLDLIQAGRGNIRQGVSGEDITKEQALRQKADRLNQQVTAEALKLTPDSDRLVMLRRQLAEAERELQLFSDRLYSLYPGLAGKRAAETISLADAARFLPSDTALLEYVVLDVGGKNKIDSTVLLCVTIESGKPLLRAYVLGRNNQELAERTDDFRSACADPGKSMELKAQELYRLLIGPAAAQLTGKKRLVICPDSYLWEMPFQALLIAPGRGAAGSGALHFLAEHFEISYSYSATAVKTALAASGLAHRPVPSGTILVMANPDFGEADRIKATPDDTNSRPLLADSRGITRAGAIRPLPGTQIEADAIRSDFPDAVIKTGMDAQAETARNEMSKYRYLHFATHGLFNGSSPLFSSIVLAQPPKDSKETGFLTAREIFDMNLAAEMVTLSACDTGRGGNQKGEGMIGLTWALFVAGAPTTVVSQWSVNDTSTAELMKRFYAGLKAHKAKGRALREASLGLMRDGKHAHPYYWAPFVLMGDWR